MWTHSSEVTGYDAAAMSHGEIADFQSRRIRGDASARDYVESCLREIAVLNPRLNAFVLVDVEGARAAARESDARMRDGVARGPLDGVAVAVKDNIDVAGLPAAGGIGALKAHIPQSDATCIVRLRERGALFLGKTLMDEAALSALGDNPVFGRCHNPRAHDHTAGGSSSGSAAAVAAGLCIAALGTDTLGSVRIPASYCGIVGFVPSAGRIDSTGVLPLAPSLDRVGVLARTVADAACVATALSDSIRLESAPRASIGVLRGFCPDVPDPILAAVHQTARALARAGHRIAEVDVRAFDWTTARRAAFLLTEVEGARVHSALLDDGTSAISPDLRRALEFGRCAGIERIERASTQIEQARGAILEWLSRCDVLLLPTTPQVAFPFGAAVPASQADLTAPASIAGLPAVSIAAGAATEGLPVGAQLVARHGLDTLLLGVAASLG
jgi:Asp-tRNA(Asn)/Glu-tRNA(Gln) amidotransferase A subunit family amidase